MTTNSPDDFKKVDEQAFRLMRASSIQDMIDVLIPGDPPRNQWEYAQAESFALKNILSCQPNLADPNAPLEIAYRVHPCWFSPLSLIKAHLGVGSIYLTRGHNEYTGRAVQSCQATASQFKDDRVLVSGGKLGFAFLAGLINQHPRYIFEPMIPTALYCEVEAEKGTTPTHRIDHSSAVVELCHDLYVFIQECAMMKGFDPNVRGHKASMPPRDRFKQKLEQDSRDLDKRTNKKLDIQDWLDSENI